MKNERSESERPFFVWETSDLKILKAIKIEIAIVAKISRQNGQKSAAKYRNRESIKLYYVRNPFIARVDKMS